MSDQSESDIRERAGLRVGSWLGAAAGAVGLGASIAIVNLGGTAIMDCGGFVASGGSYEIAHPTPAESWILPVAFVGIVASRLSTPCSPPASRASGSRTRRGARCGEGFESTMMGTCVGASWTLTEGIHNAPDAR
jgi:hypothetical protein